MMGLKSCQVPDTAVVSWPDLHEPAGVHLQTFNEHIFVVSVSKSCDCVWHVTLRLRTTLEKVRAPRASIISVLPFLGAASQRLGSAWYLFV